MSVVTLYIGFDPKDIKLKDALKKRFTPMVKAGKVRVWDAYDIHAGEVINTEIDENITKADIVLLLISPDSLDSNFFHGRDIEQAIQRHKQGVAIVIPVLLRHCGYQDIAILGTLKPLPANGEFVTARAWHNEDEALFDVERGVRERINYVLQKKQFQSLAQKALSHYEQRRWQEARQCFEDARPMAHPDFKPSLYDLEEYILRCTFHLEKDHFEHLLNEAIRFYGDKNWANALTVFEDALRCHKSDFDVSAVQIRTYIDNCNTHIRQELEQKKTEEQRSEYQNLISKGNMAWDRQDWEQAETYYAAAAPRWKKEFGVPSQADLQKKAKEAAERASKELEKKYQDEHYLKNLNTAQRFAKMRLWMLVPFFAERALQHNSASQEALLLISTARRKNRVYTKVAYGALAVTVLVWGGLNLFRPDDKPNRLEILVGAAREKDQFETWNTILDSFPGSKYQEEATKAVERIQKNRDYFERNAPDLIHRKDDLEGLLDSTLYKYPKDSIYYINRIRDISKSLGVPMPKLKI